jgi:hypothetical protein
MRTLRILTASVWYLVCTAVNNREPLFWSPLERARFMRVLNEARAGFRRATVSFYIKPDDGLELPEIMQRIKQTYAVRYNVMKHLDGHLWGDRYWSKVLEGEPPEEEIPVNGTECGDCAGSDGEGSAACEVAGGQIPKARLERGPPDGDSHRVGKTGETAGLPPLFPCSAAP